MSHSLRVDRPTDAVFAWIEDPERAVQWQPEVAEYEVMHETPEVVGTEGREVLRGSSGRAEMRVRVTAYEANRLMAFHLAGDGMRIDTAYELAPAGGGTRLTVRTDLRLPGLLGRVMEPFVRPRILRSLREELATLKRLCEAEQTP